MPQHYYKRKDGENMLNLFNLKMQHKKGFTLIELLVVIAIIIVLLVIAIPRYKKMMKDARVASWQSGLKELETALEVYASNHADHYPDSVTSDVDFKTWANNVGIADYFHSGLKNPWWKDVPVIIGPSLEADVNAQNAPTGKAVMTYTKTTDSDGNDHYTITYSMSGTTYTIKDSLGS